MANFRDSAPESLSRTIHIGSDFRTVSTYRRRTSNDHPADSRPGTSIDQADTADTVDEIKVPARLKGGLKSRIINQLCETEDFSADILHIPDQPARLVLQLGVQDGKYLLNKFDAPLKVGGFACNIMTSSFPTLFSPFLITSQSKITEPYFITF